MNCNSCGRALQEDAKYCDRCGTKVLKEEDIETGLNKKLLMTGILVSLGITLIITLIITGLGIPILIGGLFLPFFFTKKNKK